MCLKLDLILSEKECVWVLANLILDDLDLTKLILVEVIYFWKLLFQKLAFKPSM